MLSAVKKSQETLAELQANPCFTMCERTNKAILDSNELERQKASAVQRKIKRLKDIAAGGKGFDITQVKEAQEILDSQKLRQAVLTKVRDNVTKRVLRNMAKAERTSNAHALATGLRVMAKSALKGKSGQAKKKAETRRNRKQAKYNLGA